MAAGRRAEKRNGRLDMEFDLIGRFVRLG